MRTEKRAIQSVSAWPLEIDRGAIRSIEFPERGQLRSRKVVTRSRARSTGKYPSWKMGRMIQWESTPELNAFRILDSDPTVIRFSEQPCEISYQQDGLLRSHFPDILVEYADRKELWEVKLESDAVRPEIAARTALLEDLTNWGYDYKVVMAGELASSPRLGNAIKLHQLGGVRAVTSEDRESIRLELKRRAYLVWSDARSNVYGHGGREILCRLALEGVLQIDITAPWTDATRFYPGQGVL
jgi:hypothetical protein